MASQQKSRGDASVEFDLRALYYAFRERLFVIVFFIVVAVIGALVYLYFAPKIYRSQAIVQIEQAERKVVKFNDVDPQDLQNSETMKTIEANLANWGLLARVAKIPELNLTPAALALPSRPEGTYGEAQMLARFAKCVSVPSSSAARA